MFRVYGIRPGPIPGHPQKYILSHTAGEKGIYM